jgi:hypothetical protein
MLSNLPQRCTLLLWLFSVFISFLIRILSVLFQVFPVPGLVLLPIFYSLLPSSFASVLLLLPLFPISPVPPFDLCDSFFMSALLFMIRPRRRSFSLFFPYSFSPRRTTSSVPSFPSWRCWCCRCTCYWSELSLCKNLFLLVSCQSISLVHNF